jgi:hypothetical protein
MMFLEHDIDTKPDPRVCCVDCQRWFCLRCNGAWHTGQTCQEVRDADPEREARHQQGLEQLARMLDERADWFKCPSCGHLIEKLPGSCNHMSHHAQSGCNRPVTHFCACCNEQLGGPHHKSELGTGLNHFPKGLFKACRRTIGTAADVDADGDDADAEQDERMRSWGSRLCCNCTQSSEHGVVDVLCCPCYIAAENVTAIHDHGKWGVCCWYACCWCIVAPRERWRWRRMFGIRGCLAGDIVQSLLLPCCSIVQEAEEIKRRSEGPPEAQLML